MSDFVLETFQQPGGCCSFPVGTEEHIWVQQKDGVVCGAVDNSTNGLEIGECPEFDCCSIEHVILLIEFGPVQAL